MLIYPFYSFRPDFDLLGDEDDFAERISKDFAVEMGKGNYQKEKGKAIFLYRIKGEIDYTGIVACSDIKDFKKGNIKGHEKTLTAKEDEMVALLLARKQ